MWIKKQRPWQWGELRQYVDAFCFDSDGPVIDSALTEIEPAMQGTFEEVEVPPERRPKPIDLFTRYDGDAHKYYCAFGSKASREEHDRIYLSKVDTNRAPLSPEIKDFLLTREAYRMPAGVVSHHPGHEIRARYRREGILRHFTYIWGGRREANGDKVEKVVKIREYSRRINVPTERILMIGDMIPDQVAADEAGMPFALFLPHFKDRCLLFPHRPDFYLHSYGELAWLLGWSWIHAEEYEWPPRIDNSRAVCFLCNFRQHGSILI